MGPIQVHSQNQRFSKQSLEYDFSLRWFSTILDCHIHLLYSQHRTPA